MLGEGVSPRRDGEGPVARPGRAWSAPVVCALAAFAAACGGGGWVADHPDVATRAKQRPESFVAPALSGWDGVQGLSASYVMRASKGIGRATVDLHIRMRRPGDIDLLVLAPTGAVQAELRANREEIGLAFLEDRVLYRGPATDDSFERALGFDLRAADAVAALLGYGIADGEAAAARANWDDDARRIRVATPSGTVAWLHPVIGRFERLERSDRRGRVVAEIESWWPDPPIPDVVRLQIEPDGFGIELRLLGEPGTNPEFPAGFFDVEVPSGFAVRSLDDLADGGGLLRRAAPEEGAEQR